MQCGTPSRVKELKRAMKRLLCRCTFAHIRVAAADATYALLLLTLVEMNCWWSLDELVVDELVVES
jgi:hypothetical protein